jgi:hypothetical protein
LDLVGGLEHGLKNFPIILGIILPTDELIFFRGVEPPNQHSRFTHLNSTTWDDWDILGPTFTSDRNHQRRLTADGGKL